MSNHSWVDGGWNDDRTGDHHHYQDGRMTTTTMMMTRGATTTTAAPPSTTVSNCLWGGNREQWGGRGRWDGYQVGFFFF